MFARLIKTHQTEHQPALILHFRQRNIWQKSTIHSELSVIPLSPELSELHRFQILDRKAGGWLWWFQCPLHSRDILPAGNLKCQSITGSLINKVHPVRADMMLPVLQSKELCIKPINCCLEDRRKTDDKQHNLMCCSPGRPWPNLSQ